MERSVRGEDGIEWVCVQALAGEAGANVPGLTEGDAETVPVVCSPSREEATVRLALPGGWEGSLSDEDLLGAIARGRAGA